LGLLEPDRNLRDKTDYTSKSALLPIVNPALPQTVPQPSKHTQNKRDKIDNWEEIGAKFPADRLE